MADFASLPVGDDLGLSRVLTLNTQPRTQR